MFCIKIRCQKTSNFSLSTTQFISNVYINTINSVTNYDFIICNQNNELCNVALNTTLFQLTTLKSIIDYDLLSDITWAPVSTYYYNMYIIGIKNSSNQFNLYIGIIRDISESSSFIKYLINEHQIKYNNQKKFEEIFKKYFSIIYTWGDRIGFKFLISADYSSFYVKKDKKNNNFCYIKLPNNDMGLICYKPYIESTPTNKQYKVFGYDYPKTPASDGNTYVTQPLILTLTMQTTEEQNSIQFVNADGNFEALKQE